MAVFVVALLTALMDTSSFLAALFLMISVSLALTPQYANPESLSGEMISWMAVVEEASFALMWIVVASSGKSR